MNHHINRRSFIRTSMAAGACSLIAAPLGRALSADQKLRVLSIGVVGMGGQDRKAVASHKRAEIVGLCDVDANNLALAAKDHPNAFTCRDYREAFERHKDLFDAVIISVPDHMHATILLTAMAHDKHVYCQKPLVHQLEELVMVERALKAKPQLVTQLGNQRMANQGRRAAVEILRQGKLGKAIEAYVWSSAPSDPRYFHIAKVIKKSDALPASLNWDLWLGSAEEIPYCENIVPKTWRSWWDFGTNGIGDWGAHVLDVMFIAYDELVTPFSVKTDCPKAADTFHADPCKSTVKYKVQSDRFASNVFPIHHYDSGQIPTAEQLRLPAGYALPGVMTAVVCEGGTLLLDTDSPRLRICRNGVVTESAPFLEAEGLTTKWGPMNHWHAWVDNCIGIPTPLVTPFKTAVRITEALLLSVKAARYPGQELLWEKSKLAFTNHPEATNTIVRRKYRAGFEPPSFG